VLDSLGRDVAVAQRHRGEPLVRDGASLR